MQATHKWKWSHECDEAFKKLKEQLCCKPILIHYDPSLPLKLACDASNYGVGAVLAYVLPNGEEKPIAYGSCTLSKTEKNYTQVEKEVLAIIFEIHKFHQYIYGWKFQLVTDHKPLTTILGPKAGLPVLAAASARLQQWAIMLPAYQYDIEFRLTHKHSNADFLSQLPLSMQAPAE